MSLPTLQLLPKKVHRLVPLRRLRPLRERDSSESREVMIVGSELQLWLCSEIKRLELPGLRQQKLAPGRRCEQDNQGTVLSLKGKSVQPAESSVLAGSNWLVPRHPWEEDGRVQEQVP